MKTSSDGVLLPVGENLLGLSTNNNQVRDFLSNSLQAGTHLKYQVLQVRPAIFSG